MENKKNNMTDTFALIDDIKEDPTNPRTVFSDEHIEGLAQSLKTEGMINHIEVGSDMVIITGACRWRAAKLLGWTEVPVKINQANYSSYERLRHQLAENVHQSGANKSETMTPVDTSKGFARLVILKAYKKVKDAQTGGESFPSGFTDKIKFKEESSLYKAISSYSNQELFEVYHSIPRETIYGLVKEVCGETGVSDETVRELLSILDQPEFVIVDIQAGRPRTYYREADKAPEGIKEKIKEIACKPEVSDIIIQLPLPDKFDAEDILKVIPNNKNTEFISPVVSAV